MFYVSISEQAITRIRDEAKQNLDTEIIGVLIGKASGNTLVIDQAVTGEFEPGATRVTLPSRTIAKVSDKILKGEIKGNIVGWYHSHPGYGVFMSEIDIESQRRLQQFSSEVVALVIDPTADEVGLFTLDLRGNVCTIREEYVHFYKAGEPKIPQEFLEPPPREILVPVHRPVPQPEPELPLRPIVVRKDTQTLKIAAVALAIMAVAIVIGLSRIPPSGDLQSEIGNLQLEIDKAQYLGVYVEDAQKELDDAQATLDEQNIRETRNHIEKASIKLQLSTIEWKIKKIPDEYDTYIFTANEKLEMAHKEFKVEEETYHYEKTQEELDEATVFVNATLLTIAAEYYVKQAEHLLGDLPDSEGKANLATEAFNEKNYEIAVKEATGALREVTEKLLNYVDSDVKKTSRSWLTDLNNVNSVYNPTVPLQKARKHEKEGEYIEAVQEALFAELGLQIILGEWMLDKAEIDVDVESTSLSEASIDLSQAKDKAALVRTSIKGTNFDEEFDIIRRAQIKILEKVIPKIDQRINYIKGKDPHIDVKVARDLLQSAEALKEEEVQEKMETLLLASASSEILFADLCIQLAQEAFDVRNVEQICVILQEAKDKFNSSLYSPDIDEAARKAREVEELAISAAKERLAEQINIAKQEEKDADKIREIEESWRKANTRLGEGDYIGALNWLLKAKEEYDVLMSEESTS